MDLRLLAHLSDRVLREEADLRGLEADGLDRDQLIAIIRADEARAVTMPPALAPTLPPKKSSQDQE